MVTEAVITGYIDFLDIPGAKSAGLPYPGAVDSRSFPLRVKARCSG
jgi:hypothetical protein